MRLSEIIKGVEPLQTVGGDPEVGGICFDSRQVAEGCCFVAQVGTRTDGHDYIESAVRDGAVAVVCQRMPEQRADGVAYVQVADSDLALGVMADNYYGHPSRQLKLVGVTGTNGKTTTATLLHRMFRAAGYHAGLLSTIVNKIDDTEVPATHTTLPVCLYGGEQPLGGAATHCRSHLRGRRVQQYHPRPPGLP